MECINCLTDLGNLFLKIIDSNFANSSILALITYGLWVANKTGLEIQLRKNVEDASLRLHDYLYKPNKEQNPEYLKFLKARYRNAYEDICNKYCENRIDQKNFEIMYKYEIIKLVEKDFPQRYKELENDTNCYTLKAYRKILAKYPEIIINKQSKNKEKIYHLPAKKYK